MTPYTNLVLQYLRLESFHDDLVLKQVQIEDLVKEIIRKYAFLYSKGLNVNLHDLDKEIVTDKKWLLVVIEQIISNSLKYTKEGGLEDLYGRPGTLYQGYGNRDKKQ